MFSIPWPFRSTLPWRARLSDRVGRWARRRQGPDRQITELRPGRIYILPTGVGMVYALMTFAMLLGSMNYNNNLSFVLTFLLTGLGFVAMHQCQRNLVGLRVNFAGVDPVHAGQAAVFRIAITNRSRSFRHHLQIYAGRQVSAVEDICPGASCIFRIEVPAKKRGIIRLERFGIRTLFPFELFRAWAWLHMDLRGLVYPAIAESAPPPPKSRTARGHRQHDARGEEDFAGLRSFHEGDPPRHVAWKAYARTGQLLTKQFSGADSSSQWLDFDAVAADDVEDRLSILTRWILDADRSQSDYGLRLPGAEFEPGHGETHRHRCLNALAVFGDTGDTDA